MAVRPNGLDDEPQYRFTFDREKASAFGLTMADINNTLADAWGSGYINDFIDRGRVKRVFIQGDESSRMLPQDFNKWYVRNNLGQMVPFSAFATGTWNYGSPKLERYNGGPLSGNSGNACIRAKHRGGHGSHGEAGGATASCVSPTNGPPFPMKSRRPARKSGRFTLFPSWSSSCVWPALYESWSIPFAVMLVGAARDLRRDPGHPVAGT